MANVGPKDIVIDLGSGDGRNIIAAAKRGATAIGVEFNPDMVALSRRRAKEAGVADKATFIEGDMYAADISKATVLALFLLPSNLDKLAPKFLALKPGTRIVNNTFTVTGWEPDRTETVERTCQLVHGTFQSRARTRGGHMACWRQRPDAHSGLSEDYGDPWHDDHLRAAGRRRDHL
jgi:SAM-dependent methyltransferase